MPLLKSTETEIVYGRTNGDRWASGLVGLFMLAISTIPPIMFISNISWPAGHSPLDLAGPIGGGLVFEMMGMAILLFFLVTEDIILDLKTRTYRYRSGLPLLARWTIGPFSDIEDVVLRKVSAKQGICYRVALTWHEKPSGFWRAVLRDLRDFVLDNAAPKPLEPATDEMNMLVQRLALPGITGHAEAPEQVRQRSLRMTIFGTVLCALLVIAQFGPQPLLAAQFNRLGRTVAGIITSSRPVKSGYLLDFTYQVNGRTLHGRGTVTQGAQQTVSLDVGGPVEVTYLPDYPATCSADHSPDALASSLKGLGVFGVPLVLVSLYFLYRFRPQPGGKHPSNQQIGKR